MPAKVSYNDLPSYQYSPNYDTRTSAFKTPKANDPHADQGGGGIGLETQKGFMIGGQLSSYRYQEHTDDPNTDFVRETGPKIGMVLGITGTFPDDYFVTVEARGAFGWNLYHGAESNADVTTPLKKGGIPDYTLDMRLLSGKDFVFEDALWGATAFDVTPYAGLGYRFLYNKFSAISDGGYDRYSHYIYIPVGVTPRFRVTEDSRLSLNMEYDQLVYGWEESDFDNNGGGGPELINPQWHGYGLRGSAMWEWQHWGFGPFVNYWNIGTSKSNTDCGVAVCLGGDEPENQTLEGGLQANYRF